MGHLLAAVVCLVSCTIVLYLLKKKFFNKPCSSYTYCPLCASKLKLAMVDDRKERLKCTNPKCSFVHWDNPKPVAVLLIPYQGGLLLIRRGVNPRKGFLALPGGFVDSFESPSAAALREGDEETSLHNLELVSDIPFAICTPPKKNEILLFYLTKEPAEIPAKGSDAEEIVPTSLQELADLASTEQIAFDTHKDVIDRWLYQFRYLDR